LAAHHCFTAGSSGSAEFSPPITLGAAQNTDKYTRCP